MTFTNVRLLWGIGHICLNIRCLSIFILIYIFTHSIELVDDAYDFSKFQSHISFFG